MSSTLCLFAAKASCKTAHHTTLLKLDSLQYLCLTFQSSSLQFLVQHMCKTDFPSRTQWSIPEVDLALNVLCKHHCWILLLYPYCVLFSLFLPLGFTAFSLFLSPSFCKPLICDLFFTTVVTFLFFVITICFFRITFSTVNTLVALLLIY